MTTATVMAAEQTLREAQEEERRKQVADAKKQLKELRVAAKKLRAEYDEIAGEVRKSNAGVAAARKELVRIDSEISDLLEPSEDVLYDPADNEPEIARLRRRRDKVFQQLLDAQALEARRPRGIEVQNELQRLSFVAQNLENVIRNGGKFLGGWEGGVGPVR